MIDWKYKFLHSGGWAILLRASCALCSGISISREAQMLVTSTTEADALIIPSKLCWTSSSFYGRVPYVCLVKISVRLRLSASMKLMKVRDMNKRPSIVQYNREYPRNWMVFLSPIWKMFSSCFCWTETSKVSSFSWILRCSMEKSCVNVW